MTDLASKSAEMPTRNSDGASIAKVGEALPPAVELTPEGEGKVLHPHPPMTISESMRRLLGRPVFRDCQSQVDAEDLFAHLLAEFSSRTLLQTLVVQQLANDIVEMRQYETTRSAAILAKLGDAARNVILPVFGHFYPPKPGACEIQGDKLTAYGQFLEDGGRALIYRTEADVVAQAYEILAELGRPESDLLCEARLLALPQIEQLERMLALKEKAISQKIDRLMMLGDRLRERRPPQTKVTFDGQ